LVDIISRRLLPPQLRDIVVPPSEAPEPVRPPRTQPTPPPPSPPSSSGGGGGGSSAPAPSPSEPEEEPIETIDPITRQMLPPELKEIVVPPSEAPEPVRPPRTQPTPPMPDIPTPSGKQLPMGPVYIPPSAYEYLVTKADPKQSKMLTTLGSAYAKSTRTPAMEAKIRPFYDKAYIAAYESLKSEEKKTYNLNYLNWEQIPIDTRRYYEGYPEYYSSLTKEEKQKLIKEYAESEELQKYFKTDRGLKQREVVATSLQEKAVKTPEVLWPGWLNPFGDDIMQPQWMANLNVSSVSVLDYKEAEKVIAKKRLENIINPDAAIYENLGSRTRYLLSASESSRSAVLFPVTLSQAAVKYSTGKGKLTDVFGRIETGKTLLLPDVGKILGERKIDPTQGIISGSISEVLTLGKSEFSESLEKYPIETGFASFGEITGLIVGGKALQTTKVGAGIGYEYFKGGISKHFGINIPNLAPYTPKNLLRKAWWKGKEKLGLAKKLSEEQVWDLRVLSGEKKFAELPGPGKQYQVFQSTRNLSKTGDVLGIHAAPSKFRYITKIGKGSSESPGLSVSAFGRGSPHFLQISGYNKLGLKSSSISLIPKFKAPTAPIFSFRNVFRLPKSIRRSSYDVSGKYILEQPKGSYAWVAPKVELGGPELEAIVRGGSFIKRTSNYYYTTFEKVVVPLPTYRIFGKGMPMGFVSRAVSNVPKSVKDFFSYSYQYTPSISLVSPSYIGSVAISNMYSASSIVSKPSYPSVSSFPSSKPSIISSSKISSIPSYPSKPSSSKPSSISSVSSSIISSSSRSIPSSNISSSKSIASSLSNISSSINSMISSSSSSSSRSSSSSSKSSRKILPSSDTGYSKSSKNLGQGYAPYLKKSQHSNKFIRAGRKTYTYDGAMALGGHLVDNSKAATFIVKPVSGNPKKMPYDIGSYSSRSGKFYQKGDRHIERTTFRIDSPGELKGITWQGILANMNKERKVTRKTKGRRVKTMRSPIMNMDMPIGNMDDFDRYFGRLRL